MSRKIISDILSTTILSNIGKGIGFLIPFFIAAWYGLTSETDAFFFAYGLIFFVAAIFSPVVENIVVPFIAEARFQGDDIGRFVGKILSISTLILAGVLFVFLLVIKPALALTTKFSDQGLNLIFILIIETAPFVFFIVWTSILIGAFNAYKVFGIPALSPAFRAVITLSIIFVLKDMVGIHAIPLGYVVGEAVRLLILLVLARRLDLFRINLSIRWDDRINNFIKTSSYQTIAMAIIAFISVINKAMASWLGTGNVTVLEYAERLYMIPVTVVMSGIFPVLLSYWSQDFYGAESDIDGFCSKVKKTAAILLIISSLLAAVLILLSKTLVSLVYGHGSISSSDLAVIQRTFIYFTIGYIFYASGSVITRAHLALKNTKFIMNICILNCIITIILNYYFMNIFGVAGIAMASSVTVMIIAILLYIGFTKSVSEHDRSKGGAAIGQ